MKICSKHTAKQCMLVLLLVLICFLATGCASSQFIHEFFHSFDTTTKTDMVKWVQQNSDTWQKAIASPPPHRIITPEDGEWWAQLLEDKIISSILYNSNENQYSILFSNPSAAQGTETSVCLYYQESAAQIAEIAESFSQECRQKITYETETSCRWDGGGANGKGYLIIEEVQPGWYYCEHHCPT